MVATITRDELKNKMDRGEKFKLVEALPEGAFNQVHLPGAMNLPPDWLHDLAPKFLPDKTAEVVVYCASSTCDASEIASKELAASGYRNVKVYKEGKTDWVKAGLPTEGEASMEA
jgi:rhodanese-related sulfurtransferase